MSAPVAPTAPAPTTKNRLNSLIELPDVQKRFNDILGRRAPSFVSSVLSAVASNEQLKKAEPMSVISSAMIAAALDLPINASLGMAYIVPYRNKDGVNVAQFQLGYKGLIQLALRSGQYKTINATPVLEGQLKRHNKFTGEMEFQDEATSDKKAGYLLYFKLLNGYEKFFYMTFDECLAHGKEFSQGFKKWGTGLWKDDFDAMALKTVVKLGLSKYGPLSVEMQQAVTSDQGVFKDIDATPTYPDNEPEKIEPPASEGAPARTSRLDKIVGEQPNDFDPKGEYDS